MIANTALSFSQTKYLFLVSFKDKSATEYSLSVPSDYLSAKALARRAKGNIGIDSLDLPIPQVCIDSVANRGFEIKCKVKWFNSVVVSTPDSSGIDALYNITFVKNIKFVGYNINGKSIAESKGLKTKNNSVSNQEFDYGDSYTQINMLGGDLLHDIGLKGDGITIAVLDAGFNNANIIPQLSHLFDSNKIKATWNFVDNTSEVYQVASGSHGTNVLSIIAATASGKIIGASPNANFLLLRTEDGSTEYIVEEYNWTAGAAFADSAGADVINSSLGYTVFNDSNMNHKYSDMNGKTAPSSIAATIAARKGILVCNSAGNEGGKVWRYVGAPADADSILTVGAVDASKMYASFSSIGPSYDKRLKPDVTAMGRSTITVTPGGDVTSGSGTSFSSPLIAGFSACLIQSHPEATNFEVMDAIKKSASQYSNPDSLYGYGIPNFNFANLILSNIIIDKQNTTNLVNVYPNPFNDKIDIIYFSLDTQSLKIELFDNKGALVFSENKSIKQNSYNYWSLRNVEKCLAGVYFLKITEGNKNVITRKLIKNA